MNVDGIDIHLNCSSFDDFINKQQPDVVMFDRFIMFDCLMIKEQFGWRVSEQCPQALRILAT